MNSQAPSKSTSLHQETNPPLTLHNKKQVKKNKVKIVHIRSRAPAWSTYYACSMFRGIKIISETMARNLKPDYFFVTPWGFIKEFIKRETIWINKG
mgnify:CR=1 FL=1